MTETETKESEDMPIPTMAVACRPENASSGPAVSTILSGVIDSVETHVADIALPTHLGLVFVLIHLQVRELLQERK